MEWGEECEWDVKLYDRQMKTEMVQYGLPYCPLNIYFLPLRVENFIPIRIEGCSPKGSQPIKEEYGAFQRASSERFATEDKGTIPNGQIFVNHSWVHRRNFVIVHIIPAIHLE